LEQIRQGIRVLLPRLSRFALGLTRSRADADDLVQAACERALGRSSQWDPETRLDSWMFRIMQTIWFNELRSRRVRDRHVQVEQVDFAEGDDGEQTAEMRVLLRRVETEIFRLPDQQRIILMLVCVEGLTYAETAEVVSIPVGTVMSRLARARMTLMQNLGANDAGASCPIVRLFSK
jgi:RNA polymerase sigma-70 factor (ECF subfamily)